MSFLESCCENQNSSKVLLFVGIDVISRLRLCQLLHTPPFLLEPLHVDPVLLHHIVQRVIVEDVWRGSGLHVRIKKQTMEFKSIKVSVFSPSIEETKRRRGVSGWIGLSAVNSPEVSCLAIFGLRIDAKQDRLVTELIPPKWKYLGFEDCKYVQSIPDNGQQRVRWKQDLTFSQKKLKLKLVSVIGNIYDISLVLYINA